MSSAAPAPIQQRRTLVALLVGYGGYYLCRANFSVIKPLLLEAYGPLGLDKAALGWIGSLGTLAYAVGKLLNGPLADRLGGRRVFLWGIHGSVLCTLAFTLAGELGGYGLPVLWVAWSVVWAATRYVQAMGWVSLANVAAHAFPSDKLAGVMGVMALSYLVGDAAAQLYLGLFLQAGAGWELVMLVAAGSLALLGWWVSRLLRMGDEPRPAAPGGAAPSPAPPMAWPARVAPLLRSLDFWLILTMQVGLTLIRETFREWQPTFLNETCGLSAAHAAMLSMSFPLTGAVAAVAAGRWGDRLVGRLHRVVLPSLGGLCGSLLLLSLLPPGVSPWLATAVTCLIAFCALGPYTLFCGVIALNLGGPRGAGTAIGLIEFVGYLGGLGSGAWIGGLADSRGWTATFWCLTAVAAGTTVAAGLYAWRQEQRWRRTRSDDRP